MNSTEVLQELESEWKSVSYVKAVVMGDAVVDDAESETILARIQSEIMILDTIVRDFEGAGIWERRERLRDVLRSQNRSIPDIQS